MGGFVKVEIDFKFIKEWVETGKRAGGKAGYMQQYY